MAVVKTSKITARGKPAPIAAQRATPVPPRPRSKPANRDTLSERIAAATEAAEQLRRSMEQISAVCETKPLCLRSRL